MPVDRTDPLVAFDRIAQDYPVFRIDPVTLTDADQGPSAVSADADDRQY
jgi:hypothetical protein